MKKTSVFYLLLIQIIKKHRLLTGVLLSAIVLSVLLALIPPLLLEKIVNLIANHQEIEWSLAVGYFIILALSCLFEALKESMITVFGQQATYSIRSMMSQKLNRLPASYYTLQAPGIVASYFVNDVNAVESLFSSGALSILADALKLIGILIMIFTKSIGLGILLLIATPFLYGMTRSFQKKILKAQLDHLDAVAKANQQIPEAVSNIRTISMLNQKKYILKRFEGCIDQSFYALQKANFYDAIYSPIIITTNAVMIALVMIAAASNSQLQSFFALSAGAASAMIAYVTQFFEPLESIGMEIQNIQSAASGIERITAFLNEPEQDFNGIKTKEASLYAVELDEVSFRYKKEDKWILNHYSLKIQEGETVILAGRTGAGKSTIIKLIEGLYHPEQGKVLLYGQNPCALSQNDRRKLLGIVEQLFHWIKGTVKDQITLQDSSITLSQVQKALETVGLWDKVEKLEKGVDTLCTDTLFSQGQIQLLSIARAIVLEPKLLLLDEITANLDVQTEQMVLAALNKAIENRTMISVSHRLYGCFKGHRERIVYL